MRFYVYALVAAATLLSGCINDSADCTTPPLQLADNEAVALHLSLTVPNEAQLSTRAGTPERGNDYENKINIQGGDYQIAVFSDDDGSFITNKVKMVRESIEETSDSYSIYTMIGEIQADLLKNSDGFRIMVLANLKSVGGTYPTDSGSGPSSFAGRKAIVDESVTDFDNTSVNVFKPANGETPDMAFCFTTPNNSGNWKLGPSSQQLIPMFGFSDRLTLPDPSQATPWGVVAIETQISMLRSVAKVEIIDDMVNNEIVGVNLSESDMYGRYIPDITANPGWNTATQIISPTYPSKYTTPLSSGKKVQFYSEKRTIGSEDKTVWIAYIPEMRLVNSTAQDPKRPHFSLNFGSQSREFDFDNYQDNGKPVTGAAGHLESVLRNHIYRYTVTGSLAGLNVTLKDLPWDMEWDDDWHFDPPTVKLPDNFDSENPEYPYHLQWITQKEDPDNPGDFIENGYIDNTTDLLLFMKPNTDDYAECRFTLSAPLNAKWIAELVPMQGDLNAFEFVPDYSSGTIDGVTPAVVRIRNTAETVSDERNEAILKIMVEYPDKTRKEAFVLKPGSNGTNYTIVQQKTTVM